MPANDYTHVLMIIDRSGSMGEPESTINDTIGGRNAFVAAQAANPGRCTFSEIQFDHEYMRTHNFMPIGAVGPLDRGTYKPRGSTALMDAVGRAVTEEGEFLARMPEASRPGLVVVVVVTDGEENSSQEWSKARVKALVKQQTDHKWNFQFLGANLDVAAQGDAIGVSTGNLAAYASPKGAFLAASSSTTRGRGANAAGLGVEATEAALAYDAGDRQLLGASSDELSHQVPASSRRRP